MGEERKREKKEGKKRERKEKEREERGEERRKNAPQLVRIVNQCPFNTYTHHLMSKQVS